MDKLFQRAEDVHVVGTKIYKKASDEHAYSDSDKTEKITAVDLKNIFLKGCFIVDGTNTYIPTGMNVDSSTGVVTLTYVTTDGTTAVLATLCSYDAS